MQSALAQFPTHRNFQAPRQTSMPAAFPPTLPFLASRETLLVHGGHVPSTHDGQAARQVLSQHTLQLEMAV